MFPSVEGRAK